MAVGTGGRIVIEIDPEHKKRLYAELKRRGKTMREWLIERAESDLGVSQGSDSGNQSRRSDRGPGDTR